MFSRSIAAAASHFSSHSTDSKPWVQTFNKLCRCHFFSIFTWLCSCKPSTVNRCRCPTKLSLPSCHLILQVAIHQLVVTPSVESAKVVYGGSKWTIFFGGRYCCILAFLSSSSLYSDELKKAKEHFDRQYTTWVIAALKRISLGCRWKRSVCAHKNGFLSGAREKQKIPRETPRCLIDGLPRRPQRTDFSHWLWRE